MNTPLISVIVPIYNVERCLRKCIESILNQTYQNLEIILVDDGSPDKCGLICEEYASIDMRVKVIHKANGGLSSARNTGLDVAIGDYIGFVDSDDYLNLEMYDKLYNAISSANADLVICNYWWENEQGIQIQPDKYKYQSMSNSIINKYTALQEMSDRSSVAYITAVNKLYRYKLLNDIRFPIGKLHEDEFTIHRILDKCVCIATISDELYCYVQRKDSIMGKSTSVKHLDQFDAMIDRFYYFQQKLERRYAGYALMQATGSLIMWYRHGVPFTNIAVRLRNLTLLLIRYPHYWVVPVFHRLPWIIGWLKRKD